MARAEKEFFSSRCCLDLELQKTNRKTIVFGKKEIFFKFVFELRFPEGFTFGAKKVQVCAENFGVYHLHQIALDPRNILTKFHSMQFRNMGDIKEKLNFYWIFFYLKEILLGQSPKNSSRGPNSCKI